MDHVTTPDWAREFCASTPNCRLVDVPALGHGPFDLDQWTHGECYDHVAATFLEKPQAVDTSCVATMRPPAFK